MKNRFSYNEINCFSGIVAERVDLRLFLAFGMIGSGILTIMFGASHMLGVHTIWYLISIQVVSGMVQTTGWPGVVTVMANWFGKGRRGLIMGIWNSHTSIGNILGALIAGAFVNTNWGLSFTMPGLILCLTGLIVYFFLVPDPTIMGLQPPKQKSIFDSNSSSNLVEMEKAKPMRKSESAPKLIDSAYESEGENYYQPSSKAISFMGALSIPGVLEFSLCLFFAKLVSYTFLFWLPNYISSTSGLDASSSATLSTFFDIGGIIGGIVAGMISDHTGMSATTCAIMLITAVPVMFLYQILQGAWCPLIHISGLPVLDMCYYINATLLILTGI